jgi:Eukaryotic initiation factor 4E
MYYHLPHDKQWDLSSYKIIMEDIDTVDKLIALNEKLPDNAIKFCMLFVMRNGITPLWEDPLNRTGGCFSFKVINKDVPSVWRNLMYALCGETLFSDTKTHDYVNGITISPKKSFCIIKIWLKGCGMQDPRIIIPIMGLPKEGCLFKKHEPEF